MKFLVPFLGKTRETYLAAGIEDYAERVRRFFPVELPVLKEKHSRSQSPEMVKKTDARQLLEKGKSAGVRVALDPTGKTMDSEGLAKLLAKWDNQGVQVGCFYIGGHLGLHSSVIDDADLVLSLSRLTFTHEMTRLILLEQLYRACSINAGHKYHK